MAIDPEKVQVERLNGTNWPLWSRRMEDVLTLKNCYIAVTAPAQADAATLAKARALIRLSVSDTILATIDGLQTPVEIWNSLQAQYNQAAQALQVQLRQEMSHFKKNSSETLLEYFTRAKLLRTRLVASGVNMAENDVVIQLLIGLPESWSMVSTAIQAGPPVATLDALYTRLSPFESRIASANTVDQQALVAGNASNRCASKSNGNRRKSNRTKPHPRHAGLTCHRCGVKGHIATFCTQKPDIAKSSKPNHIALVATDDIPCSTDWVLDSGATSHMCYQRTAFVTFKEIKQSIIIGNGHALQATGVGSIALNDAVTLIDVLYVPALHVNLLSVKALTARGAEVSFSHEQAYIRHSGRIVFTAKLASDGLYALDTPSHMALTHAASQIPVGELWHRRYGHVGHDSMK
jgi:hypothetical protein